MSAYRPPTGFDSSNASSTSSSLPNRPNVPVSSASRAFKPAFQNASSSGRGGHGNSTAAGFAGFAPRAVASTSRPNRITSPIVASGPQPPLAYGGQQAYPNNYQQGYQQQAYYAQNYQSGYSQQTPLQIRNPFAPTPPAGAGQYGTQTNTDPDMEAQIAQWQSAYTARDESKPSSKAGTGATTAGASATVTGRDGVDGKTTANASGKPLTVQRSGGGQKWSDNTLLEWNPAHHRIFVGNLAGEVTDDTLLKAFAKYPSVQKARVIRDKVTTKSKGYGFVSFSDSDDYFKAARDMQGKYIGSHPVKIKKSTTEIKAVPQKDNRSAGKKGSRPNNHNREAHASSNGILGPSSGGGIAKKSSKTKGGLKLLG